MGWNPTGEEDLQVRDFWRASWSKLSGSNLSLALLSSLKFNLFSVSLL